MPVCDVYFGLIYNIRSSCADPLYLCFYSFVAIFLFMYQILLKSGMQERQ